MPYSASGYEVNGTWIAYKQPVNKMKTIYVISGYSGAGKDTCADYLNMFHGTQTIKFADPGKRALEFMLGCPVGLMDDRIARMDIAPHCGGLSYLQVLIKFWKHRDLVIGDKLFPEQTYEKIVAAESDVCITDMRSMAEMWILNRLYHVDNAKMQLIWVKGGSAMESDQNSYSYLNKLSKTIGQPVTEIDGHGFQSKTDMLRQLNKCFPMPCYP
jgi:hypothetical protein